MIDTKGSNPYSLMRALLLALGCIGLIACNNNSTTLEDYDARIVTLPDGTTVKAEVMMNPTDMSRGMMFRDTFPEGRGMLFIHGSEDNHRYFMYQVKIPLDMVWMDKNRQVVEMAENVPPCKVGLKASECPTYGGDRLSMFVLELPAGYARKHGIREGTVLQF
jgi:uncharacterized protein